MNTYSYPYDYDEFVFCPIEERPHSVYRLFDEAGRLLYVGCTREVNERLYLHDGYWSNTTSLEFKGLVARVESVEYPDRDTARVAERAAIKAEAPLFNKAHNDGRQIAREEYIARFGSPKTNATPAPVSDGEVGTGAGQTSVKSATPTDRESTEGTLSGGRGANLPAAPSDQLALDLSPLVQPGVDPEASLRDKFEAFHSSNPHVLVALETLTRQYLAAGRNRISIGMVYEVLRYTAGLRTTGEAYVLDNNHRAFYARLMVERNPHWAEAFRMRASQADAA